MTTLRRLAILVAVLALAIAGCSDDSDTPADTGTTDTTAPSVASVTPVDVNHIDVTFNEAVQRATAEDVDNYVIVLEPPLITPASGGVNLVVYYAALNSDGRTVSLTIDSMAAAEYRISVTGVSDVSGNVISTSQSSVFTGTTDADETPPEIVYSNPGPGATNVGIGQSVVVQFSEIVVLDSVDWTGGDVQFDVFVDGSSYILYPGAPLAMGTIYTITIVAHDLADNAMTPDASWQFTTTNTADTTPPYVTSSTPGNLATNVGVNSNLSLTFSEAVNQFVFFVARTPDPGDGIDVWSNSGKTVTFDPDVPLLNDTQYSVTILPNSVMDLAGNGITDVVSIVFTTGSSLESGSITGTLAGDPTSDFAADPTGAMVIAPYPFPFTSNDFDVYGSDVVEDNGGVYDIRNLPDGVYYPVAVLDTNGDGEINTEMGDAVGAYGANLAVGDFEPDSIPLNGGAQITDADFPLYDPSAISGTVTYSGNYADEFHDLYIGVFDTTAFDPQLGPDYGTMAFWPYDLEWTVDELGEGLLDGVYYVGAYLDANNNAQLDAGDAVGFYGGLAVPTPIRIENGGDAVGIVIPLEDQIPPVSAAVTWPRGANRAPWLKRLSAAIRQHALAQQK